MHFGPADLVQHVKTQANLHTQNQTKGAEMEVGLNKHPNQCLAETAHFLIPNLSHGAVSLQGRRLLCWLSHNMNKI